MAQQLSNTESGGLIVAVDGPSGTGKSTMCRALAKRLDAKYVDTGAMYRVATLAVLRAGIDPADTAKVIDATADLPLEVSDDPDSTQVLFAGEDVKAEIRGAEVTRHVSAVSAIPEVRVNLVELQRKLAREAGRAIVAVSDAPVPTQVLFAGEDVKAEIRGADVPRHVSAVSAIPEVRVNLVELQRKLAREAGRAIVEGRDIGTVVLPDAPAKVFMTASAEVRAKRRYDQDVAAGREADFDAVLADVQRRDEADSSRATSPLKPADDAVLVDTSEMTPDEVLQALTGIVERSAR
ncbi:(d)CMP kinase [Corynebacterium fournieri]|uniref:(d)CMP kinase n=1 Tax=Corynebacterium fournieri TaxID=1852390 RepID=UPI000A2F6588|nr:(d)CMP kinase [Corynebacterium fournieri]